MLHPNAFHEVADDCLIDDIEKPFVRIDGLAWEKS